MGIVQYFKVQNGHGTHYFRVDPNVSMGFQVSYLRDGEWFLALDYHTADEFLTGDLEGRVEIPAGEVPAHG